MQQPPYHGHFDSVSAYFLCRVPGVSPAHPVQLVNPQARNITGSRHAYQAEHKTSQPLDYPTSYQGSASEAE